MDILRGRGSDSVYDQQCNIFSIKDDHKKKKENP